MTDQQQIDKDEISLKELIQKIQEWIAYLKTQWILIIGIAALGGLLGFVYAYSQPITYKAELTYALEEEGGGSTGGAMGLASSFGFDFGGSAGGAFSGSNLTTLMKSRRLIEKTLLSSVLVDGNLITIAEYYIQINKIRESWDKKSEFKNVKFLPNADRSKFNLQQDIVLNGIFKDLISPKKLQIQQKDKKIAITSIEVTSEDEKFAKVFCESIAKEISIFYTEIKSKKARINMDILQFQADSIRTELNSAINGVAVASDNVFNLNSAMNVKKTQSAKRQVDVQANTAILNQLVGQLELAKVNLRKQTPLIQLIDTPILPLEKDKVGRLKSFISGGLLAGFLTVLYLMFGQLYRKMVA
jgi:uncharacterized protein involved in exopolysaccharide biosynthesis